MGAVTGLIRLIGICAIAACGTIVRASSATATVEPKNVGSVVRPLTRTERTARMGIGLALRLRNQTELASRVARGEVIAIRELTERYLPDAADWNYVAGWAQARGYTVEPESATHLTVFAQAPVTQLEQDYSVGFARVLGADGHEYTSALGSGVVPSDISARVSHIGRLQPHLKPRHPQVVQLTLVNENNNDYLAPKTVADLYGASATGLDGEGETIVILGTSPVNRADLTAFWSRCGLPTTLAQFTEYDPDPQFLASDAMEETKDIEWASAMAPKAKLLYLSTVQTDRATDVLLERLATDPTIHQLTISFDESESDFLVSHTAPHDSNYFLALAAAGVTTFVASGDAGSNAAPVGGTLGNNRYYQPGGVLAVDYPASDPYVTAVGGTALGFVSLLGGGYSLPYQEGGWCLPDPPYTAHADQPPNYGFAASTGGVSLFFDRMSWQTGHPLLSGPKRAVPDIAAIAAGAPLPYAYYAGGADIGFAGTSLSSPIWGGLCALVNQARAKVGMGPIGLLGPKVYPLIGTNAFHSITTGSQNGAATTFTSTANNGAYGVGPNYNHVSGLGSPDLPTIIAALTRITAPDIWSAPSPQSVVAGGTVSFSAAVTGDPTPVLTWRIGHDVLTDGVLADGTVVSGATTRQLVLSHVPISVNGRTVVVTATNSGGTITSTPVALTVTAPAPLAQVVAFGTPAVLSAPLAAPETTYQWSVNGIRIVDGTQATYSSFFPGTYTVDEITSVGVQPFTVAVLNAPVRQVNLSSRARVTAGSGVAVVGFVVVGPEGTSKDVLLRAVGPALRNYGIVSAVARPTMTLYTRAGTPIATNAGWQNAPVRSQSAPAAVQVRAATLADMDRVNAFRLASGAPDAAMVATVPAGAYTFVAAPADDTSGIVLAEVYELNRAEPALLANISTRANVGAGEAQAVVGLVSSGTQPGKYLIRAAGPSLAKFDVEGAVATPILTLYDAAGRELATNRGWQKEPEVGTDAGSLVVRTATVEDMDEVGAFHFSPNSADSALVVVLPPGLYTCGVIAGTDGVVLVESYQLKP